MLLTDSMRISEIRPPPPKQNNNTSQPRGSREALWALRMYRGYQGSSKMEEKSTLNFIGRVSVPAGSLLLTPITLTLSRSFRSAILLVTSSWAKSSFSCSNLMLASCSRLFSRCRREISQLWTSNGNDSFSWAKLQNKSPSPVKAYTTHQSRYFLNKLFLTSCLHKDT